MRADYNESAGNDPPIEVILSMGAGAINLPLSTEKC